MSPTPDAHGSLASSPIGAADAAEPRAAGERASVPSGIRTASPAAPSSPASNLVVVAAVLGMLAAGAILRPGGTGDGMRLSLFGISLPTACVFRLSTGLPCPGCGLTRSIALLMHGRLGASLAMHPFGLVVVGLALLQLPPRAARGAGSVSAWIFRYDRFWLGAVVATAVLMLVWWTIRIGLIMRLGL